MDEEEPQEEVIIEGGRAATQRQPVHHYKKQQEKCNSRLDELAKPRKWAILGTYRDNAHHFEPQRLEALRARIQEEFSMTPEETEKYMERFKKRLKSNMRKREMLKELKKERKIAKRKAFMLLRKYLKRGMMYACKNPPPPLVSPVVRAMSDAILKILCEIHVVDIPGRRDNDKLSQFLLATADWMAIALCRIYYEVELDEKLEIERLKQLEKELAMDRGKEQIKNAVQDQGSEVEEEEEKEIAVTDLKEKLDEIESETEEEGKYEEAKDEVAADEVAGDAEKPEENVAPPPEEDYGG